MRGYRSTLDHMNKPPKSPSRKKKNGHHNVDVADITEEGIHHNISDAMKNLQTNEKDLKKETIHKVLTDGKIEESEPVESSIHDKTDEASSEVDEQSSSPSLNGEEVVSEIKNDEQQNLDINGEKETNDEEETKEVKEMVEERISMSQEGNEENETTGEEKIESVKEEDRVEQKEEVPAISEAKIKEAESGKEDAEDESDNEETEAEEVESGKENSEVEEEESKGEAKVEEVVPTKEETNVVEELKETEAEDEEDKPEKEETEIEKAIKEEAKPVKEETEVKENAPVVKEDFVRTEEEKSKENDVKDEEEVKLEDGIAAQEKNHVEESVKMEEVKLEKNLQDQVLDTQDSIEVSLSNLEVEELKDEVSKQKGKEEDNLEKSVQGKVVDEHDSAVDVEEMQSDENAVTDSEGEIWRNMISSGESIVKDLSKTISRNVFLTTNIISSNNDLEPGAKFPPKPDRYHLYVSHACPWAHRTVITVSLKGLEDVIGITYVHPTWQYTKPEMDEHRGWVFGSQDDQFLTSTSGSGSFPVSWGEEDPLMGAKTIREIYEKVNDTTERYILPVLWDKKLNTIVSNESSEIIRMLNFEFNEYASNPDLNLYPDSLAEKIDEINQWVSVHFYAL